MTRTRSRLSEGVFWSVPVALFLPALYYSLTTPFGLVDDYNQSRWAAVFDIFGRFDPAFGPSAAESVDHPARYRPFWVFYNAVTWTIFGPVPWLHHLARWATVAGAVFAFTAAFSAFPAAAPTGRGAAAGFVRLLPPALLVHLWIFFPNQPAARLGPAEVNTVFFMGLCTWMTARLLVRDREGGKEKPGATRLTHALFVLGCLGLLWSKEVNIAVALWMLVFHCAPLLKGMDRTRAVGGLVLTAAVVHTARTVGGLWEAQGYGTAPVTPQLIMDNAGWIAAALFQVDTSPVITAGLAVLSALLPVFVVARAGRPMRFGGELLFVLFLLGQFASLYLMLCTSWQQVLRYWYSLVPVFTTLLAFSARFMLEFFAPPAGASVRAGVPARRATLATACALAGFLLFFIGCNYSNVLLQTVVQHRARHTERELLAEITRLLDRGAHVRVMNFRREDEPTETIVTYYRNFLPRFHGREYDIRDLHIRVGPPTSTEEPRYMVTHSGDRPPSRELADDYRLLSHTRDLAAVLQGGAPHWTQDAGVAMRRWYVASTDPDYGRNGLMQIGPHGGREPAGEVALDTRLDNSITRHIRDHSIAGSLFTNDPVGVSYIHGHDSALEIHDGLPCVDSLASAEAPHDVHIAWFFSPADGEGRRCVNVDVLWDERPARWWQRDDNVLGVGLVGAERVWRQRYGRGPWRWQRADAMPDDSEVPDDSTWSEVDDEWGPSWQHQLAPDDEGKFFRAHVEYEKEGRLTRAESAVIGPTVLDRKVTTDLVDLWESPELELAAELDAGVVFRAAKNGVSPFQAKHEATAASGEPVIDDVFDIYLQDDELTYFKGDGCTARLTQPPFFLHVFPVSAQDLPPDRRAYGFDSFSFDFGRSGVMSGGKCFLTVPFPGYAVRRIAAGQYVHPDRGEVWSGAARWD